MHAAADGSNHSAIKLFPIPIQYFKPEKGRIQVHLLELQALPNETADIISNHIHSAWNDKNLFEILIVFSRDNTNANFDGRERHGIKNIYRILTSFTQYNNLRRVGYIAHIFSNSVHHVKDFY